jgi:hypothetical protein
MSKVIWTNGGLLSVIEKTAQDRKPLDADGLHDFLKQVFAPPAKGTERSMLTPMGWIKWKSGVGVPMVSADGEEWHHPNDEEFKMIEEFFRPLQAPSGQSKMGVT